MVNRIREVPHRTRLLVVDRDTDDFLRSSGMACTENLAVEMGTLSPRPSPAPTPSTSPILSETSPLSTRVNHTHCYSADSPTNTVTQGEAKGSSETSSAASDTEVRVIVITVKWQQKKKFRELKRRWREEPTY